MTPNQLIFIVGFPRGGTRWLLSILGAHPDVAECKGEPCTLSQCNTKESMISHTKNYLKENEVKKFYVQKAPLDAKHLNKWKSIVPESKVLFIIRDPRDVVTSHQRGDMAWLEGRNRHLEHVMKKLDIYFDGYREYKDDPNLMLTRYESIYKDFYNEVGKIYDFIGLDHDANLLSAVKYYTSFEVQAGRKPGIERREEHRRKGIIGDYIHNLSLADFYKIQTQYLEFMKELGYERIPVSHT